MGWGPALVCPEEGFWARVCKAIFLRGRKGRWGNEHWVWGEGEKWQSGRGRGRPRSTVPGATRTKARSRAPAPSASSLAPTPPPQDPEAGLGGHTAAEPSTLAPAAPPGPGRKKVLGWADSGVNSIEFSFGYTLKAKVSWTYSQNG